MKCPRCQQAELRDGKCTDCSLVYASALRRLFWATNKKALTAQRKPEIIDCNMSKKKKIEIPFTQGEMVSLTDRDLAGKWLVLHPMCVSEVYRTRPNLLWRASGGFGCTPGKIGRGVFAKCFSDGESAKWYRQDFLGIFQGELPNGVKVVDGEEIK